MSSDSPGPSSADRPTVTDEPVPPTDAAAPEPEPDALAATLHAIALRVEAARRLAPPAGTAVLRSVVEATVALFGAEAASLALHDPATGRLVFEVAAGEHGQGVVGLAIETGQGVAGYVFSTGQPLALSDVARDARFGRATAEQTGLRPALADRGAARRRRGDPRRPRGPRQARGRRVRPPRRRARDRLRPPGDGRDPEQPRRARYREPDPRRPDRRRCGRRGARSDSMR